MNRGLLEENLFRRRMWFSILDGFDRAGATIAAVCFVGGLLTYNIDTGNGSQYPVPAGAVGTFMGFTLFSICGYAKLIHLAVIKDLEEVLKEGD